MRRDFGEHRVVVGRVHHHTDMRMVLGRGTHHGRATDVDELDAGVAAERVQVHHHQRDGLDVVRRHVGLVLLVGGVGQQATVHLRVQRDDSMIEDCRQPGEVGEVGDGHAGRCHRGSGTTTADQAPPGTMQTLGELDDAGLVEHGEQRNGHATNVRRS